MRVLLDTHVYLWYLASADQLSKKARATISRADEVFVSAVSIWEASLKASVGKLEVVPEELLAGIDGSGFSELPVSARHALLVATLPEHHRDPFDRLLIAQAMHEPLRLLTADKLLTKYSDLVELV